MTTKKVAFVGLGVMGYPMAGHLSAAGLDVTVYNRNPARSESWLKQYAGRVATSPADAATGADVVFCCVGRDDDVRDVTLGAKGAFQGLASGGVFVDHTTASATLARELDATAKTRGFEFLDAPVSGGQQGAEKGALTIMCGGELETFERVQPIMGHYARAAQLLGPAGSGQLCKMVNQICIAGVLQGLAEGLHFAQAAGLDAHRVVEVIAQGAAQSWQMENRHGTMLDGRYDHGFAVDWMRKDLAIALAEARTNGASIPVAALVDQFYAEVQAMGGARWDTSSLFARMSKIVNNP